MITDFELIQQYKRACEYAIKKEKLAYGLEWTFVKNLICKAYGIEKSRNSYPDSENDNINVNIINDNINDSNVREVMHAIRQKRNWYEHKDEEFLDVPNINNIKKELDYIINFINNDCNNSFQFIGKYVTLRIEKDEIEEESALEQVFQIEEERYAYTLYNNAYARENSYFLVNKYIDKCKNPILAVIHNILIRSDNIKINNLILEEKLSVYKKQEVYKFQIALLTLLAENCNNENTIKVSKEEEKLAKIALKNIMYYYEIISKMACEKEKLRVKIVVSKELAPSNIQVNDEEIYIRTLTNSEEKEFVNNSHIFLSNTELKYEINNENEKYYNVLLNEIFEIKEFRKGQIDTINDFFKDNRPLMSILPTGYGKSLIYQFIAMLYPKIMWIVSPDEFLVNDQLSNLMDKNIYRASYITDIGTINPRINMNNKKIPIFKSNINYITAEGILSDKIMKILRRLADENYISAISVDECHKTSIWGHQFSSRYATLIRQLTEYVPECKFLLLSATVATRVKKEILGQIKKLKIIQPCPLIRDNIQYDIVNFDKIKSVVDYIEKRYKESSSLSGEISDLSIVVNNDKKILSEIMSQLRRKDELSDKCFLFDGDVATYEEFKISHRAILFVTDEYLTGINVNNLNNLFIIGMPISKEWFYQQSGRVGRYLKDGFVSVLLLEEENTTINNIINNELKQIDDSKMKKCINHTNLTEVTNPIFAYDINTIETACKTIEEIKKCVFVPTGQKHGRVIGRIPSGMFGLYDMPIYILLYMGIIKSLRYLQEEKLDITYRIYVEPNIDIWYQSSKEKVRKNIMNESYNEDIERSHLYELEKTVEVEDIVKVVLHWLDYNSSKLKKEMFKNIYKLIMQNEGNTDTDYIENDLTNYFSVGSSDIDYEIEESNFYDKTEEEIINSIDELEFNDFIPDSLSENSEMTIEELNENKFKEQNDNEITEQEDKQDEEVYEATKAPELIENETEQILKEELVENKFDEKHDDDERIEQEDKQDEEDNEATEVTELIENETEQTIKEELAEKKFEENNYDNENIEREDKQDEEVYEAEEALKLIENKTEQTLKEELKENKNKEKTKQEDKKDDDFFEVEEISKFIKNEIEKSLKEKEELIENKFEKTKKVNEEFNQKNNKNENNELIKFLKLKPEDLEIIISIVKEDIIKNKSEFKAHIERSIEEKYSKNCLVALCVYELLDIKERVFLRLKELHQEDKILFYDLLNKIKDKIDLTKVYWIDKFLIKNQYAFSFLPLRYYTFYEINRTEKDIIKDIESIEDKIPKVEEILKCIYNEGKYTTALKGLTVIDFNYKNIFSLDNFEKLVELNDYLKLLEIEKNILPKRKKIIIDEFLKEKNKNRYYYYGILGLIKMLIER